MPSRGLFCNYFILSALSIYLPRIIVIYSMFYNKHSLPIVLLLLLLIVMLIIVVVLIHYDL